MTYDKSFKEEAVRLSDEIGVKKASAQLGVPYYTLTDWRRKQKRYGGSAYVGSGHKRVSADSKEQEIYELRTCIHNRRTPSGRVFSRHTVSISLEIRQDSCGKFPCLAAKSLAHPAFGGCEYRF